MTDNDPTPRVRPIPPLFLGKTSDQISEPTRPSDYLTQGLTNQEHDLLTHCMREAGDPAPFAAVAKIAVRQYRTDRFNLDTAAAIGELHRAIDPDRAAELEKRMGRIDRMFKRVRKYVAAAVLAAGTSAAGVATWALNRSEVKGAEEQRMINMKDTIDRHEIELRSLREELGRRSERGQIGPRAAMHAYLTPPMAADLLSSKGTDP